MKPKSELRLDVPWGHIAGLAWGSPEDHPVLLVHGGMDNAGSFTRLIQLLPENYYYVAIDLPGHGLSSRFADGLQLDFLQFISVVYYVLEGLKWKECYYIGHSFGGVLGAMTNAILPGRLQKIVALDLINGYMYSPEELIARVRSICNVTFKAATAREPRLYTKEEAMDALMHRRPFELNSEAAVAMFERGATKIGDKYKLNRDERMKTYPTPCWTLEQYAPFYREGRAPILLVLAQESLYHLSPQPETLEFIQKHFSDKITTVRAEGNHDVHNNNPEVIAPFITKFFINGDSKL